MISLPCKAFGIDSTWIGVGRLNPNVAHDSHSSGIIPNSANVFEVVSIPSAAAGDCDRAFEAEGLGEREPDAELDEPASEEAEAEADMLAEIIYMCECLRWPKKPALHL